MKFDMTLKILNLTLDLRSHRFWEHLSRVALEILCAHTELQV